MEDASPGRLGPGPDGTMAGRPDKGLARIIVKDKWIVLRARPKWNAGVKPTTMKRILLDMDGLACAAVARGTATVTLESTASLARRRLL
jgi:hypothetical protein